MRGTTPSRRMMIHFGFSQLLPHHVLETPVVSAIKVETRSPKCTPLFPALQQSHLKVFRRWVDPRFAALPARSLRWSPVSYCSRGIWLRGKLNRGTLSRYRRQAEANLYSIFRMVGSWPSPSAAKAIPRKPCNLVRARHDRSQRPTLMEMGRLI